MRPTNKIGSSREEEMKLIIQFVRSFDVNKLLYAINGKCFREEDIISLGIDIQEYCNKLSKQREYLYRFGKIFNNRFTTDDNKCFDTSLKASRKIRSLSAGIRAVVKPFIKVSRRQLPQDVAPPSIMDRSIICTCNYCGHLFGLSNYPDCVRDLFRMMLQFYEVVDDCISECTRILKEEKELKADKQRCLKLLDEAMEQSRKTQLHIVEAMVSDQKLLEAVRSSSRLLGDKNNHVLSEFKEKLTKGDFAQRFVHNCTTADVGTITLYTVSCQAEEDPLRALARLVFGYDDEKIDCYNYVISHFDSLLPPICKKGKMPAYRLYVFMEWCGCASNVSSFLNYFFRYYKAHGGKWEKIGASAINGAKNKRHKVKDNVDKVRTLELIQENMEKGIQGLVDIFHSNQAIA